MRDILTVLLVLTGSIGLGALLAFRYSALILLPAIVMAIIVIMLAAYPMFGFSLSASLSMLAGSGLSFGYLIGTFLVQRREDRRRFPMWFPM